MLKHSDLFDELPVIAVTPHSSTGCTTTSLAGRWEMEIRGDVLGYGFVVDYLAEVLRSFRDQDYSVGLPSSSPLVDISTP